MLKNKDIASYILPTSATMVGVCLTVLSLAKLIEGQTKHTGIIDELMAFNSFIFLLSAAFSYFSVRSERLQQKLENFSDRLFMTGLTLMVIAGFVCTYELY